MKLMTPLQQILRPLEFFKRAGFDLAHITSTPQGLSLDSRSGEDHVKADIIGRIVCDAPVHATVRKEDLVLFTHALKAWPNTHKGKGASKEIVVDVQDHTLRAFPMGAPKFLFSLPLCAWVPETPVHLAWIDDITVATDRGEFTALLSLIGQPSTRNPSEGITRVDVEPGQLRLYSYDGRVVVQHQIVAQATGHASFTVLNASLRSAISLDFLSSNAFHLRRRENAVSLGKEEAEIVLGTAPSDGLDPLIDVIDHARETYVATIDREGLLEACRSIANRKSLCLRIAPSEGIAELYDSNQLVRRTTTPVSSSHEVKFGVTADIRFVLYEGDYPAPFIVAVRDLITPLTVLSDDRDIEVYSIGEEVPEYIVLKGFNAYPQFLIATHKTPGGK